MDLERISIKILIVGPIRSGKTSISNYLADTEDAFAKEYRATQGVRIVEFESNQLELEGKSLNAEVELWDCSGDLRFEKCWPAIRHKSDGAIFVCNPEENVGNDLLLWYNEFAQKSKIYRKNFIILLHSHSTDRIGNDASISDFKIPNEMIDITCVPSNIERDGEELRLEFNNFLCNIIRNRIKNEQ